MCVYLPHWPLQRLLHDQPGLRGEPAALVDSRSDRAAPILCCSTRAGRAGVRPGMPAAEALAIEPGLHLHEQDPEADRRALQRLAPQLEPYSPVVGLEEGPAPESLLAEVGGCGACFGGEDRLLERAVRELSTQGWVVRVAIADTAGASWALAHHGRPPVLAPAGATLAALRDLPAAALRLPETTLQTLAALGIQQVGQLLALPRDELPSRFGPILLRRLDQALGRLPEPITPCRPAPEVQAFYRFEHPCEEREALHQVLGLLTERIWSGLNDRGWGARRVECWLYQEGLPAVRFDFGLCRPSSSSDHLGKLVLARLEQTPPAAAVQAVWLRVPAAEPVGDRQGQLFEVGAATQRELAGLIDRLSNRLGPGAVTRILLVPDPQPEYACCLRPVIELDARRGKEPPSLPFSPESWRALVHRPLVLWPAPVPIQVSSVVPEGPPIRFSWAGTDYQIVQAHGPERIETGWWRGQDIGRDYYIVTTQVGTRFWIFRHREDGQWFLHGCFD